MTLPTTLVLVSYLGAANLPEALGRFGLNALEPKAAPAFTLPNLDDKDTSLASLRGKWVLLTFFATWCGPCASEMPSLSRFADGVRDKKLEVLGIGFDGTKAELAAFARQRGATFPILVDTAGQVAAMYRASSIPLSYLIDPAGQLVGMSRGARDWSKLIGLADVLSGGELPTAMAGAAPGANPAQVELPPDLVPPSGKASLANLSPAAGDPFIATVEVEWAGNLNDYILQPPEMTLPQGVRLLGTAAKSSSTSGAARIAYELSLVAEAAGAYALDPIELRFIPNATGTPAASRISGPTVNVGPPLYSGLTVMGWGTVLGGFAVVGSGAVAGVVLSKRRRRKDNAPLPVNGADALATLQRQRLNGDAAGAYLGLIALAKNLRADIDLSRFEGQVEGVRYGGVVPSAGEMEYLERAVQRCINERSSKKTEA